jgi:hypothetical protein
MSDIDALLKDIDTDLAEMESIYQRDLTAKQESPDLVRVVRRIIADERSVLDFVAHAVAERYGSPKDRAYFPICIGPGDFPKLLDSNISALTTNHPKIAAAFERHQPYHEGKGALQYLPALSRVNKHQRFSAQTRQETRWLQSGGVGWNPDNVKFGGHVAVSGNPINPQTQRPPAGTYTETIFVDWKFVDPPVPVRGTLTEIARIAHEATSDIRHEARLP